MRQTFRPGRRRGFTLIELVVVIGIMAILIGILVPTVMTMRRNAEKTAARLDLQTIALALDAYKKDFGDYPRPPMAAVSSTNPARNVPASTPTTGGVASYRVLAWALVGPYNADASGPAATAVTDPWGNTQVDGADGLGFRTTWTPGAPPATSKGGRIYQPYLPVEKFPLSSTDFADPYKWDLMDRYGAPIEYFPRARQGKFDKSSAANSNGLFGGGSAGQPPVYDYRQQWVDNPSSTAPDAQAQVMKYLRKALGDDFNGKDLATDNPGTAPDDVIGSTEALTETPPFILVSRGPSKAYPDDKAISFRFEKCDVITNLQH